MDKLKPKKEKLVNLILVFLILAFLSSTINNFRKMKRAREIIEEKKVKLEDIKRKTSEVENRLNEINSEAYLEKQLRDSLGLAKEGEIIVILPDEAILRSLAPKIKDEIEDELPDPNWKKWAQTFNIFK